MDSIKLTGPIRSLRIYGFNKFNISYKFGREDIQDICFDINNNKFIYFPILETPIFEQSMAEINFANKRYAQFNLFPGYVYNNNLYILNGDGLKRCFKYPNPIDLLNFNLEIDIPYMFSSNFTRCLDEKEINCSYIINYILQIKSELKKFYINKLKSSLYDNSYIQTPNEIKALMYKMIYEMERQRETPTGFSL